MARRFANRPQEHSETNARHCRLRRGPPSAISGTMMRRPAIRRSASHCRHTAAGGGFRGCARIPSGSASRRMAAFTVIFLRDWQAVHQTKYDFLRVLWRCRSRRRPGAATLSPQAHSLKDWADSSREETSSAGVGKGPGRDWTILISTVSPSPSGKGCAGRKTPPS